MIIALFYQNVRNPKPLALGFYFIASGDLVRIKICMLNEASGPRPVERRGWGNYQLNLNSLMIGSLFVVLLQRTCIYSFSIII